MKDLKYFIVMFDEFSGMVIVAKTNNETEDTYDNGEEAHMVAKEIMDEWLDKKRIAQQDQYRANRETISK
jgi:hypothetical protein